MSSYEQTYSHVIFNSVSYLMAIEKLCFFKIYLFIFTLAEYRQGFAHIFNGNAATNKLSEYEKKN